MVLDPVKSLPNAAIASLRIATVFIGSGIGVLTFAKEIPSIWNGL
jgi:hypothetical protein